MIKKICFIAFILSCLLVLSGCSDKAKVTGTVKFPDGSTLNKGTVVFESDKTRVSGVIKNGYFTLGEKKDGDGVPFGSYSGWITGALEAERPPGSDNNTATPRQPGQPPRPGGRGAAILPPKYLIDRKFESAETSGFKLEVKSRGAIVYNIDVTAP